MHRTKAALMMALLGTLLFAAFIMQDLRNLPSNDNVPWGLILRYAVAMTIGGALVGFLCSGLLGRAGTGGWLMSLLCGLMAAALSGLLGSAIGLLPDLSSGGLSTGEMIQIAAGLLVLPLAIAEQPWLALPVAALLIATHLWCRAGRADQRR